MDKNVGEPLGTAYNNSQVFNGFVDKTDAAARGVADIPVMAWDAARLVAWNEIKMKGVNLPPPEMHSNYGKGSAIAKAEGRAFAYWGEATLDTVGFGLYSNGQEGTRAAEQYYQTGDTAALRRYYGGSTAQALFFIGGNRLLNSPQRTQAPAPAGEFQFSGPGAIGKITTSNAPQMPSVPPPGAPPVIAGPPALGSLPIGNMPAAGAPGFGNLPIGNLPRVGAPKMPSVPVAAGPTLIIDGVLIANLPPGGLRPMGPAIPNLPLPRPPICPKSGPVGVRISIKLEKIPANGEIVFDPSGRPIVLPIPKVAQPPHAPTVNIFHILGEITKNGHGTGGHWKNPKIRIDRILVAPNADRVYVAKISVQDAMGRWHAKPGKSTMWPDNWTMGKIQQTIQEAFVDAGSPGAGPRWKGQSKSGFKVEGFPKNPDQPHFDVFSAWPDLD